MGSQERAHDNELNPIEKYLRDLERFFISPDTIIPHTTVLYPGKTYRLEALPPDEVLSFPMSHNKALFS